MKLFSSKERMERRVAVNELFKNDTLKRFKELLRESYVQTEPRRNACPYCGKEYVSTLNFPFAEDDGPQPCDKVSCVTIYTQGLARLADTFDIEREMRGNVTFRHLWDCAHTVDPHSWLKAVKRNGWTYQILEQHILESGESVVGFPNHYTRFQKGSHRK